MTSRGSGVYNLQISGWQWPWFTALHVSCIPFKRRGRLTSKRPESPSTRFPLGPKRVRPLHAQSIWASALLLHSRPGAHDALESLYNLRIPLRSSSELFERAHSCLHKLRPGLSIPFRLCRENIDLHRKRVVVVSKISLCLHTCAPRFTHAEYLCSRSMTSFVEIFALPPCGAETEVATGAIMSSLFDQVVL